MRIAQAARVVGCSADFIRRLERRGVITLPRDLNGHRRLGPDDLVALRRVVYPHRFTPDSGSAV